VAGRSRDVGYIVGRTTVRADGEPVSEGKPAVSWHVSPIFIQHERGLALSVSF